MIYLVRHGLDDENYIGGYSDVDLTDFGKRDINELGKWLKIQGFDVSKIYTSDIKRAVSTTNIINSYLQLPVCKTKNLRELDKGMITGMKKNIAFEMYPEYMDVKDIRIRYPKGESMLDLYLRIRTFLEKVDKYDGSILVTHRGVINMIYCLVYNDELSMNKEKYNVTHGSVHEFDIKKSMIRRIK